MGRTNRRARKNEHSTYGVVNKRVHLFEVLFAEAGRVVSGEELIRRISIRGEQADLGLIRTYISYLRAELRQAQSGSRIETVDGGYRLILHDPLPGQRIESVQSQVA